MVWPILISVSLAPGSYFRISANDAVATTSAAAMVTDFRALACKPSLILALPLAARFALGVAIAPSLTLRVTIGRALPVLIRKERCDGRQPFPFRRGRRLTGTRRVDRAFACREVWYIARTIRVYVKAFDPDCRFGITMAAQAFGVATNARTPIDPDAMVLRSKAMNRSPIFGFLAMLPSVRYMKLPS